MSGDETLLSSLWNISNSTVMKWKVTRVAYGSNHALLLLGQMTSNIYVSFIQNRGSSGGSVIKNLPASAGDAVPLPGLGRSIGEGNNDPLQYSCLGNPMDRGSWWAMVHMATKSQSWVSMHALQVLCKMKTCLAPQVFTVQTKNRNWRLGYSKTFIPITIRWRKIEV